MEKNVSSIKVSNEFRLACLSLGVFLALASTSFTVYLLWSRAESLGFLFQSIFVVVGICFDLGGKILVIKGAYYKLCENDIFGAFKLYALGALFVCVSLLASQALTLNLNNEIRNQQLLNSESYKTSKNSYNSSNLDIQTLKSEIKDNKSKQKLLEDNKITAYKDIETKFYNKYSKQIANYEAQYLYKNGSEPLKAKRDKEIQIEKDKYDNDISILKTNIITLEQQLKGKEVINNTAKKELNNSSGIEINSTNGTDALSVWVSKSLNLKDERQVDGWLNFFINILIELLSVVLISLSDNQTKINAFNIMKNKVNELKEFKQSLKDKPKVGFNSEYEGNINGISRDKIIQDSPTLSKNRIGFKIDKNIYNKNSATQDRHNDLKVETQKNTVNKENSNLTHGTTQDEYRTLDFNIDDIREYLNYIYNEQNKNISPGISKIINNTGLSNKQVRGIKYYLEKKQILQCNGTNTLILCDINKAKNILNI